MARRSRTHSSWFNLPSLRSQTQLGQSPLVFFFLPLGLLLGLTASTTNPSLWVVVFSLFCPRQTPGSMSESLFSLSPPPWKCPSPNPPQVWFPAPTGACLASSHSEVCARLLTCHLGTAQLGLPLQQRQAALLIPPPTLVLDQPVKELRFISKSTGVKGQADGANSPGLPTPHSMQVQLARMLAHSRVETSGFRGAS